MAAPALNIADLTAKVALITGASSGIGRAIAQAYAAAGAYVVNADLTPNPPDAPQYVKEMQDCGEDLVTPTVELINKTKSGAAVYVCCDVAQGSSVKSAVEFAVKEYGRLDIIVNNAGTSSHIQSDLYKRGSSMRLHETPDEFFERDLSINSWGVWHGIKYAAEQMLKQEPHPSGDRGWIITICTIMAQMALPQVSTYSASKGVGLSLTRAAAMDYAKDRIHVNCVVPGWVNTPLLDDAKGSNPEEWTSKIARLHPWGRLATPGDVAGMAVFLAGPGATFVTGQAFNVDGGYTIW